MYLGVNSDLPPPGGAQQAIKLVSTIFIQNL